jgi:hypothetical protein
VNKIFPAVNLVFVLAIALLITLLVKTWTHPTYPFRVDGSTILGSPKNLQKLEVSKPIYKAGAVSRVVQANLFRKERSQYVPPKPVVSLAVSKPTMPPPNLVLKGVLMLGGTKIAILQGTYSTLEGEKVIQKNVKKKGYSLGQIVGGFELTKIEKTWVILDDKKGGKIRLKLSIRSADKLIVRKGTSLFQKSKKFNSREIKSTSSQALAQKPTFRVSGANSPPPARVHISGQ